MDMCRGTCTHTHIRRNASQMGGGGVNGKVVGAELAAAARVGDVAHLPGLVEDLADVQAHARVYA